MSKGKAKDLAKEINALIGSDVLTLGSDKRFIVEYIPTGILPLDDLLQGGLPRGRSIEFYGDYSTLKSYVALRAVAQCQHAGGIASLVDTEHAFDPDWAKSLGVRVDDLLVQHPPTGEEAVDTTELLIRNKVDLVVWDSVAATLPRAEQEKAAREKVQMARQAFLFSAAMRKLTSANSQTALVFVNQTRMNVGQMFGSPETTPGGKAIPFYASMRVALRKAGKITRDLKQWDGEKDKATKEVTGMKIRATLEKSKLNKPHRDTLFIFDLEHGEVDETSYLVGKALDGGLIVKKGNTWIARDNEGTTLLKAVGRDKFFTALREDDTCQHVMKRLLGLGSSDLLGLPQRAKKKGVPRKRRSSKRVVRGRTQ